LLLNAANLLPIIRYEIDGLGPAALIRWKAGSLIQA